MSLQIPWGGESGCYQWYQVSDETLKKVKKFLRELCASQLQSIYDMGGVKLVDQHLTMVEFLRLRTLLGEDLKTNIQVLHDKTIEASHNLEADVLKFLGSGAPEIQQRAVKNSFEHFWKTCTTHSLTPPLLWLCAQEDADVFLQQHLQKAASQAEAFNLIEKLSD